MSFVFELAKYFFFCQCISLFAMYFLALHVSRLDKIALLLANQNRDLFLMYIVSIR